MANIVIMPKQGLQMTEGLITKWLKAVGDKVTEGEPLFEMETDKLTITIDSSFTGTLLKIIREEGEEVPITEPIAVIGEQGEDISSLALPEAKKDEPAEQPAAPAPAPVAEAPAPAAAPAPAPAAPVAPAATVLPVREPGAKVLITPRARMRCAERGIADYTKIPGTGDNGLIIERDVLNYKIPQACASSASVITVRALIGDTEKYVKSAADSGMEITVSDMVRKSADAAAKKFENFKNITVKAICETDVEEYLPALPADVSAVLSAGGIYTDGDRKLTALSIIFNEDEIEAVNAAEYLSRVRTLLENPLLMLAI